MRVIAFSGPTAGRLYSAAMKPSRFLLQIAALCMALCVAPARAADAPAANPPDSSRVSDPQAIAIADRVIAGLGGAERWNTLRGLRWSFESVLRDTVRSTRRHSWDKYSGWHKVSGTTRDGTAFTFIDNINTGEGRAWMNGHAIEGDSLAKLLKRAKSLWTNDTYWMLMPYKLRDPGVILKYDGQVREGDYISDRLALSFEQVGETPGDRYWVFVNRATHRVEKWEFILQGAAPPANVYAWEGWEQHDGLWFPTIKRGAEDRAIYTRNIETVNAFPASEFEQP